GCVFAALCYAEFAAMAPVAGSAYTYAYASLGEVFAWIIGWDLILEYAMCCACVAAAWANYLNEFLTTATGGALAIPWWLCSDPFTTPGAWFNLPAVGIMVLVTFVVIVGSRESAVTNAVLTLVKLAVVLFVIGLGAMLVEPRNWTEIPYTQRLSRAELVARSVVGDMVRGDRRAVDLTPEDQAEIDRKTEYVRARLAAERIERLSGEAVAQGRMTPADAAAQVTAAGERLAAATSGIPGAADGAGFDAVIASIQKQAAAAETEKWGLLGAIVDPSTLKPIDDATRSNFAPYGFSGIMLGAAIVFFAFIGFDSISTHSEEAINPQRDVPLAILASLAICTVLYMLVAAVITGMEPYPEIDVKAAIAAAFRKQAEAKDSGLLRLSSLLISTGALAGMTSVLLVTFLSQARIFLAMARDKLLPHAVFGVVHPRFQTPHISTALTGAVICVAAAFTPIEALEKMVNIGTLFAFVIVCITVLLLRIREPGMPRPFRCPMLYLVAPLGLVVNVAMMLFLPVSTWLRLAGWMAIGVLFYFAYGYRHSLLRRELVGELAKHGIAPTGGPLEP
ncbi:MAG TPA: amino acid permease, partial [Lacipirellulaceae bacterium]|nr:amino acid permease [Lacipirellulaceae bacterium]